MKSSSSNTVANPLKYSNEHSSREECFLSLLRAHPGWNEILSHALQHSEEELAYLFELSSELLRLPSPSLAPESQAVQAVKEMVDSFRQGGLSFSSMIFFLQEVGATYLSRCEVVGEEKEVVHGRSARIMSIAAEHYYSREHHERLREMERVANFSRVLSHEIKTPLNNAIITTNYLKGRTSRLDQERADLLLGRIEASAHKTNDLVDALRTLMVDTRSGTKGPIRWESLLPDVLQSVLGDIRSSADEAGVDLIFPPALPSLRVPSTWLHLVLCNLISNGIKYSDPEKDSWVEIRVVLNEEANSLLFEVEDNGLGISPDVLPHLFSFSYRSPKTRESHQGSGLGLFVASAASEQMGSDLHVESEEGKGSLFWFEVDLKG